MPAQSKRQRAQSAVGAGPDVTPARDLKAEYDARPDQRSMAEIMDDENAAAFAKGEKAGHQAGRKAERDATAKKRASGSSSGSRSAPRSSARRGTLGGAPSLHDGAGLLLGAFAYALFINYVRGGFPQMKAWLRAKFLNDTTGAAGPNLSTPNTTLPEQKGPGLFTGPTGSRLVPVPGHPGEYSLEPLPGQPNPTTGALPGGGFQA